MAGTALNGCADGLIWFWKERPGLCCACADGLNTAGCGVVTYDSSAHGVLYMDAFWFLAEPYNCGIESNRGGGDLLPPSAAGHAGLGASLGTHPAGVWFENSFVIGPAFDPFAFKQQQMQIAKKRRRATSPTPLITIGQFLSPSSQNDATLAAIEASTTGSSTITTVVVGVVVPVEVAVLVPVLVGVVVAVVVADVPTVVVPVDASVVLAVVVAVVVALEVAVVVAVELAVVVAVEVAVVVAVELAVVLAVEVAVVLAVEVAVVLTVEVAVVLTVEVAVVVTELVGVEVAVVVAVVKQSSRGM